MGIYQTHRTTTRENLVQYSWEISKKIKKNVFNVHFGWGRQSCLHLEGKLIFLTRKFNVFDKYYTRSGLIYFIFWSLQKHTADGRPTISAHPGNYNSTLSIWYLRIWFVKHYLQLFGILMVWKFSTRKSYPFTKIWSLNFFFQLVSHRRTNTPVSASLSRSVSVCSWSNSQSRSTK